MRVLGLIYFDGIGGAEKFILHLAKGIIDTGSTFDVVLITPKRPPKQLDEFLLIAKENNVKCIRIKQQSLIDLRILKRIDDIYRDQYDIINSHLLKADLLSVLYKKVFNKSATIVSTKHGYTDKLYQSYILKPEKLPKNHSYIIYKVVENYLDESYCCSYSLRNFLINSGLNNRHSLRVIQHGFDFPEIDKLNRLKNRIAKNQIIMLGRLHKIKGHQFAFKAIALLDKDLDINLMILGDGEEKTNLLKLAKELKIEDKVTFLGFKKDIYDYLCCADLLLVPSYVEGLPLMILEAFNAELTVIGWDIPGVNELVENDKTGILVEPYDIDKLSLAIKNYFSDKDDISRLNVNAKEVLSEKYSSERMVNETMELFQEYVS